MKFLKEHVSTQYNDFQGRISIDFIGGALSLFSFSRDHNVDIDKYFPIGLRLFEYTTNGIGERGKIPGTIYAIDQEKYGRNFDEISSKIQSQNGEVDVEAFNIEFAYSDFNKYFKRFDLIAVTHISEYITKMNIKDE